MNTSFSIFPEAASSAAESVDQLYLFLVALTAFFSILIAGLVVYFSIKYRRGNKTVDRIQLPTPWWLEVSWMLFPVPILLLLFFWGATLYFDMSRPPDDTMEVTVVAKQWMWKFQQPSGRREIDTLHVPVDRAVRLTMTSQDVIHSLYFPVFRVKQDVLPGRLSTLWFKPTKVGEFNLFCAEYCGTNHSQMIGRVVVMSPQDYQNWLTGGTPDEPPAVSGGKLFEQQQCTSCHKLDGSQGRGPSLIGLAGKQVTLASGQVVTADDAYLRQSILQPATQVVRGYEPIMSPYEGRLTEEQVFELIAYIKSVTLKPTDSANTNSAPEGAKQ